MKTLTQLLVILLLAASCGPKNEEVTDEQIDVGGRVEMLDSIANTKKDAVKTDENDITPTLPLPQPAIDLLSDRYPGWDQPELAPGAKEKAEDYEQGPLSVRGDFNGDNLQDIAMQLHQGKEVVMVAILQDTTRNWEAYELQRDILFNERGKLQSLYVMHLIEKGEEPEDLNLQQNLTFPHDAVAITIDNSTTAYLFENGKFKSYTSRE